MSISAESRNQCRLFLMPYIFLFFIFPLNEKGMRENNWFHIILLLSLFILEMKRWLLIFHIYDVSVLSVGIPYAYAPNLSYGTSFTYMSVNMCMSSRSTFWPSNLF